MTRVCPPPPPRSACGREPGGKGQRLGTSEAVTCSRPKGAPPTPASLQLRALKRTMERDSDSGNQGSDANSLQRAHPISALPGTASATSMHRRTAPTMLCGALTWPTMCRWAAAGGRAGGSSGSGLTDSQAQEWGGCMPPCLQAKQAGQQTQQQRWRQQWRSQDTAASSAPPTDLAVLPVHLGDLRGQEW